MNSKSPCIVGLAGGTASGKSSLVACVKHQLGDRASVVALDNYYRSHSNLSFEERSSINYDQPDAFDWDLIVRHISALHSGQSIEMPSYDYALHTRSSATLVVPSSSLVFVEGVLALWSENLRTLYQH
ncbi:MAG: uridine kinase, partial [Bdellovibrionales bacterium]|nr:uridine kinase [Bdellovibrionales bacterium]